MNTFLRITLGLLLLCASPAFAATSGTTTKTAKTAPPVDVDLSNQGGTLTADKEGNSDAFARANHQHKVSGVLPQTNGGTGTAGPIACNSNSLLTSSGGVMSCVPMPGVGATGSPVPTTAAYAGGKDSTGNTLGVRLCDQTAPISKGTGTTVSLIVPQVAGKRIYACGFYFVADSQATIKVFEADADSCVGGALDVTGASLIPTTGGVSMGLASFAIPFMKNAGKSLCLSADSSANVGGWLSYTQQ